MEPFAFQRAYPPMAYRRRSSEHHDSLERWQTTAARTAGLFLLVIFAGLGFVFADISVPPQHLPWKPLRLADPIGAATRPKLSQAELAACRRVLTEGGVTFQDAPGSVQGDFCKVEDAIFINGGATPLRPTGAVMACPQALAFALWDRQVVQPVAMEIFGQKVTAIDHFGSYACRRRYGRADTAVSEHAYANALDVAAFRLADGTTVSVEADWKAPGPKSEYLRRVRDGACRLFGTTLSPDYNQAHWNHLHLDMGRGPICH
jgi:hypothetical protein